MIIIKPLDDHKTKQDILDSKNTTINKIQMLIDKYKKEIPKDGTIIMPGRRNGINYTVGRISAIKDIIKELEFIIECDKDPI